MFSVGGKFYNGRPLTYTYMPDRILEQARNVSIHLHGRFGRFVKLQLWFAARWIILGEVTFDSGEYQELISYLFPPPNWCGLVTIQLWSCPLTPISKNCRRFDPKGGFWVRLKALIRPLLEFRPSDGKAIKVDFQNAISCGVQWIQMLRGNVIFPTDHYIFLKYFPKCSFRLPPTQC